MSTTTIVLLVVFGILTIFSVLLIGKEAVNLRDFKYTFKCEHCATPVDVLEHDVTCKKCHRHFKDITKQWDHYLTFRVSKISTKGNREKFEYKRYVLPFKLELTVDIFCCIVLSVILLSMILEVLK